ncbi:MAG: hypothetical protein L0H26_09435, partial [Microlunatus sp.]|nr:hypothetical protein [Microlunatus sp.]
VTIDPPLPRWHAALAYALLGPPALDLTETGSPRIDALVAELANRCGGPEELRRQVVAARRRDLWPYAVPEDLRRGLGAAQFGAAWTALIREIGPDADATRPVVSERALNPAEHRLVVDRPPHHGG